jgi:hypothetical protein
MTTLPLIDTGSLRMMLFFFGISLTAVIWVFKWNKLIPLSARALWAYTLVSALYLLEFPAPHFSPFTSSFQAQAGQVVAEIVFIPLLAMMCFNWVGKLIPWAAVVACLATWFNVPGFLNAPSFNSAFAATCFMLVPWWVKPLIGVTVIHFHGSTASAILGVQVMAYTLYDRKLWPVSALIVAMLGAAAWAHSGHLFDGGERLEHWTRYMEFWAKEPRWIWLGTGAGSFTYLAAMLDQFKAPLFLQMHSDWLQILFELGAVGLVLAVFTFGEAVKRAWKEPDVLTTVLACGVFALTYHPLRYFPSALLTAWIFVRAVNYKSHSRQAAPSSWSPTLR